MINLEAKVKNSDLLQHVIIIVIVNKLRKSCPTFCKDKEITGLIGVLRENKSIYHFIKL